VLRVVYPDRDAHRLLDAFASLGVVSGESRQHRTYAEVLRALGGTYRRLPEALRPKADEVVAQVLDVADEQLARTAPIAGALVRLDQVVASAHGEGADRSASNGHRPDRVEQVRAMVQPSSSGR
jgi:hypothetical protein